MRRHGGAGRILSLELLGFKNLLSPASLYSRVNRWLILLLYGHRSLTVGRHQFLMTLQPLSLLFLSSLLRMVTSLFLWLFIPFSPLNPNLGKKRLEVEEERKRSRLCFILFWIVNNRRRIRRLFPYLFRRTVLSFFRSALSLYPFASFPTLLSFFFSPRDGDD